MRKVILIISIILFSILLLSSCDNSSINNQDSNIDELIWSGNEDSISQWASREDKIEELKNRLAVRWLITKWDMYYDDKEYRVALVQYLKVLKELPNDKETNLKTWNIYYDLWSYSKAYEYYSKIKDYNNLDTKKAIYSLINSNYEKELDIKKISKEIDTFILSEEEKFYYKNSLICVEDFSKCRWNFEEYFNKLWEDYEISFSDLQEIKQTLTNYKNFQLDDLTYKAALFVGTFYKNWFYYVALKKWEVLLEESPNYKPVMKIVAKSAYEIWDYNKAKEYIIEYNKIENNDPDASYFLWRIYEKLWDKILAIIHFTKAINIWYSDTSDIRRRLIFIYYDLNDDEKMLRTFKELIESNSKNLILNDYNLAIYYHILNNDLETAKKFALSWIEKFKDSELFYTYYAWIVLQDEKSNREQLWYARDNINQAMKINKENPMTLMVKWIEELKNKNYTEAKTYFEEAKKFDQNREYKTIIEDYISKIPENE